MPKRDVDIILRARDKATKNVDKVSRAFKRFGNSIGGLVALAGVGFGLQQAVSGISSLINQADDIGKAASRLGITAEAYQALTFAARRVGASSASIEVGFRRMSRAIIDAEEGSARATRMLGRLGLTIDDLKNLRPDQQFHKIGRAMNRLESATERTAIAQEFFGRSGTQLIPLVQQYEGLRGELEAMNGLMSNEGVKAAERYKDSVENLTTSFKALTVNSGIVSWLDDVLDRMSSLAQMEDPAVGFFSSYKEHVLEIGKSVFGDRYVDFVKKNFADKMMPDLNDNAGILPAQKGAQSDFTKAIANRRAEEERQRKIRQKTLAEDALAKQRSEQEKLAAEQRKYQESIDKELRRMQDKTAIQQLINDGREKEAFIQERLNAAQERALQMNRELSAADQERIRAAAAALFEQQNKGKGSAVAAAGPGGPQRAARFDGLAQTSRFLTGAQAGDDAMKATAKHTRQTERHTEQAAHRLQDLVTAFEGLPQILTDAISSAIGTAELG